MLSPFNDKYADKRPRVWAHCHSSFCNGRPRRCIVGAVDARQATLLHLVCPKCGERHAKHFGRKTANKARRILSGWYKDNATRRKALDAIMVRTGDGRVPLTLGSR